MKPDVVGGGPAKDAPARPYSARAAGVKNSRYALWKNPENLTGKQKVKLAWIVQTDPALGRAYYLKEGLRVIFKLPLDEATEALDKWVSWARRCRIPAFVKLQKSIVNHRTAILASIEHGLSNGRVESMNTKILVDKYKPHVLWNDIEWPDAGKHFGEHGLGRLSSTSIRSTPRVS